jgi:hypothetical protein
MNVKFTKDVTVDFLDKFNELSERSFRVGTIIKVDSIEDMGSFYNIHLNENEVLIDVHKSTIKTYV